LASETGIAKGSAPMLVDVLAKAFALKAYTSTQEQAWMLLAARTLGEEAANTALSLGEQSHKGPLLKTLAPAELESGFSSRNDGDTPVDAVVSVIGAAFTAEPPISKGITLERAYYTLDGRLVDLKSGAGGSGVLKQNDRLVVVLKLETKEPGGRILL